MKFYSETLKKLFDSEEELLKEEKKAEESAREEQERKNQISINKKAAATKVEIATEEYDKAADAYEKKKKEALKILDSAEDEAAKIFDKANAEAQKILNEADKSLKEARINKLNAISEFNREYGPYKTVLTKENAEKEYNRFIDDIDTWINKLYRFF